MVFLLKRDYDTIPEDELSGFTTNLQELGISLGAYRRGFSDNHHPNAVEDRQKYESTGDISKKRKLEGKPSTSSD